MKFCLLHQCDDLEKFHRKRSSVAASYEHFSVVHQTAYCQCSIMKAYTFSGTSSASKSILKGLNGTGHWSYNFSIPFHNGADADFGINRLDVFKCSVIDLFGQLV